MELTRLVGSCDDGDCPTLYLTERGTLAVQGETITEHGLTVPGHESLVEIPLELVRKAIRDNLI